MGGQACILYGAAEFSRDIDVAVRAESKNLARLQVALDELQATPVFVPALGADVLRRGHACHFRSARSDIRGLRIDVMSSLHGCEPFERLWNRRRTVLLADAGRVHVLALEDLVQAKKTQRDKDWPMLRRLVEADYHRRSSRPAARRVAFWLREARTPDLLIELARAHRTIARRLVDTRPLLASAIQGGRPALERALQKEQDAAREADRAYWAPLRSELARWRRGRRSGRT
jgi:hypothetical protein